MKKYLLLSAIIPFFFRVVILVLIIQIHFVPNYTFTVDINMNLPAYSNLQYASNAIYYPGVGARGIIVLIPVVAIMPLMLLVPNQAIVFDYDH
jgi:hypothetical protein